MGYSLGPISHGLGSPNWRTYAGQYITDFGHINSIAPKRSSNLDETGSCYYNVDENIVQDAEGVTEEITIQGVYKGGAKNPNNPIRDLNTFIAKLMALQIGEQLDYDYTFQVTSQDDFFYFTSDNSPYSRYISTAVGIPVKVGSVEINFDTGSTDTITYTITLKVGVGA